MPQKATVLTRLAASLACGSYAGPQRSVELVVFSVVGVAVEVRNQNLFDVGQGGGRRSYSNRRSTGNGDVRGVGTRATVQGVACIEGSASAEVGADLCDVGVVTGSAGEGYARVRICSERTCLPNRKAEAAQRLTAVPASSFRTAPPLSHRQWGKTATACSHLVKKANKIRPVRCPTHFPPGHRNPPAGWANPAG